LLPGFGRILVAEGEGVAVLGVAAGAVGGKAETDCAWAVAATPAIRTKTRSDDLNKLCIPGFSIFWLDYAESTTIAARNKR
jgi:hypothetical protein